MNGGGARSENGRKRNVPLHFQFEPIAGKVYQYVCRQRRCYYQWIEKEHDKLVGFAQNPPDWGREEAIYQINGEEEHQRFEIGETWIAAGGPAQDQSEIPY